MLHELLMKVIVAALFGIGAWFASTVVTPWLLTWLTVGTSLKGKWIAFWDGEGPEAGSQVRDEITITRQRGNSVRGQRIWYGEPERTYRFDGYYRDGLLSARYVDCDRSALYAGVALLRLDEGGRVLAGKVMYPQRGNMRRIIASNENCWSRQ